MPARTEPVRVDALWSHVHALHLIAQLGSFTQAAERLGLSKAAVSQRLTELERAVGVTLVRRTTRSVQLTEAGQRLVEDTAEGFAQIARTLSDVRDLASQPGGLVRVTAPVALGRQHVAPHFESFLRTWPNVRIELDLSDRVLALARDGFDLAVRHTSSPPDTHVAWKLCASRSLLVGSAAYLRKRGRPESPADLARHDCLTYLRPGPPVWQLQRELGPGDPERVRVSVQGPLRAGNSEVLRDAVLQGLGIGLLPDFSAAQALRSGRLIEVLPGWRPVGAFGDAIYAIHPWSPTTPRAVQALVQHLQAKLASGFE